MPYTIYCENMATAAAWAQRVRITDFLDPNLDIRTFRLGTIGWNQYSVTVPENRSFYTTRVPMPEQGSNIVADVSAGVDLTTGEVFWTIQAIDLNTGQPPLSIDQGVLPPNTTNHIGEGFVTYTVRPRPNLPTGTLVTNKAVIVFDANEAIETPTVTNTLDSVAPSSAVLALPASQPVPSFAVAWSGKDDTNGAGVKDFDVYVSDNGGPFLIWLGTTTNLTAIYEGEPGHTYRFYSRARDHALNIEDAPATPDTQTVISNNRSPAVGPVPDQFGAVGSRVAFTNVVLDAEQAVGDIAVSMPGAPIGASLRLINGTNVVFNWKPSPNYAGTTNLFQIVVTDSGPPSISVTQTFVLVVPDYVAPGVGSAVLGRGQTGCVPVQLYASTRLTNVQMLIEIPTSGLADFQAVPAVPSLCDARLERLSPTRLRLTLSACPGQSLPAGLTQVADLCFRVEPAQASGIVPLRVTEGSASRLDGGPALSASPGPDGKIVVIGREPMLEATVAPDGTRGLTLYGHPNTAYVIEYTTDLASGVWQRLPGRILLTSVSAPVPDLPQNQPRVFYRAAEYDGEPPALEGSLGPDGSPRLTLFGKPGTVYLLQYTTGIGPSVQWETLQQITLTNTYQYLKVASPPSGAFFFRLIEARRTGPTLRALVNPDNSRTLIVNAESGKSYTLESNLDVGSPAGWQPVFRFTPTNAATPIAVTNVPGRVFYRLKQD